MVLRMIAVDVATAPVCSHSSASAIQASRSVMTWYWARLMTIFSMMRGTRWALLLASSSLAAVTQVALSVGTAWRAWFSTFLAFSWVSSLASASHISTLCGTHSTARASMMRASVTFSSSIAAFHKFTALGTASKDRRKMAFFRLSNTSRSAAANQILTEVGRWITALARMLLAVLGGCKRAASSHTSSDSGHISQPSRISFLAAGILFANSSRRAAAIQAGPRLGLVVIADCSNTRARWMSLTSAMLFTLMLLRLVK
mmetsp:Transcript_51492/g.89863  ORF Transcript_51492/g.89863 Transcript_51492/m.89863 type:complete len:258 (-) Transcript_51492:810-1583(-)